MITERDKRLADIRAYLTAWGFVDDEEARFLFAEIERLEKAFEVQKLAMQALETRDRSALGVINDKQTHIIELTVMLEVTVRMLALHNLKNEAAPPDPSFMLMREADALLRKYETKPTS